MKINEALKNAKIEREVEDEKINNYIEKIDKDNFCNYIIRMSNNILDLSPVMYKQFYERLKSFIIKKY